MVKISIKLKPDGDTTPTSQGIEEPKPFSSFLQDPIYQTPSSGDENEPEPSIDPSQLRTFTGHVLPYELRSLKWDRHHRVNKQNIYCYCGKPRTLYSTMLQCNSCKQWFHYECLKQKMDIPPSPGDWAYVFRCAVCTKGTEYYEAQGKNWTDIVRIAMWNLLLLERQKGSDKRFFQYKEDICAYIDDNWEQLCYGKIRTKTWENTIGSALSTKAGYFQSGADTLGQSGYWCLRDDEDPMIARESGSSKVVLQKPKPDLGTKRKPSKSYDEPYTKKKKKHEPWTEPKKPKLPAVVAPPPEPAPLPKFYYNPLQYNYTEMVLAKENSAQQVQLLDKYTAMYDKGYRTVRASFGVSEGSWYFEVNILNHVGNTRLGWSTEKGDVQTPVGYDKYSYSYRDKEGTKFHQARGAPYGEPYGPGDVVGFYINLPQRMNSNEPNEERILGGSEVRFFRNGIDQGLAFSDLFEGNYYPAASLYSTGKVQFNFGPNFRYPPRDFEYKPICDVVPLILAKERAKNTKEEAVIEPKPVEQTKAVDETTRQNGSSSTNGSIPAAPENNFESSDASSNTNPATSAASSPMETERSTPILPETPKAEPDTKPEEVPAVKPEEPAAETAPSELKSEPMTGTEPAPVETQSEPVSAPESSSSAPSESMEVDQGASSRIPADSEPNV